MECSSPEIFYYGTKCIEAQPQAKDGLDGYAVTYSDGYKSWSPKDVFESAYQPINALSFGHAFEALKAGSKVARAGWNASGMHVEAQYPDAHSKMTHPYLFITVPDCAEGLRKLPWQPAMVDIFANDWQLLGG